MNLLHELKDVNSENKFVHGKMGVLYEHKPTEDSSFMSEVANELYASYIKIQVNAKVS